MNTLIRKRNKNHNSLNNLKDSIKRYKALIRNLQGVYYSVNIESGRTFFRGNIKSITGYSEAELTSGNPQWSQIIHPDDLPNYNHIRSKLLIKPTRSHQWQYRIIRKNHEIRWVNETIWNELDSLKKPVLIEALVYDMTEHKTVEESLRASEERLKAIIQESPMAIEFYDENGKMIFVNNAWKHIFGMHNDKDIAGFRLFNSTVVPQHVKDRLRRGEIVTWEFKFDFEEYRKTVPYPTKKKGIIYLDTFFTPLKETNTSKPWGYLVHVKDITERRLAEEALLASREQLRNLSIHLQSIREDERTLISRRIHDDLAQVLTGLKMELSWLEKRLDSNQELLRDKVKLMSGIIDTTMQTAKMISADLRPELLDDLGIVDAIEWAAEQFEQRTSIKCQVNRNFEKVNLDRDRSTTIFRIFQEALSNIYRHAQATSVKVNLNLESDQLILEVIDNGKGITDAQIRDPRAFGLIAMRERAQAWGGEVIIKGIPNKSTILKANIPIHQMRKP